MLSSLIDVLVRLPSKVPTSESEMQRRAFFAYLAALVRAATDRPPLHKVTHPPLVTSNCTRDRHPGRGR